MTDTQNKFPRTSPSLLVPRAEAEEKIKARIQNGREIRNVDISSRDELDKAFRELDKWSKYNIELLGRMFDDESIVREYHLGYGNAIGLNFSQDIETFRRNVDDYINNLESIIERLPLMPEKVRLGKFEAIHISGSDVFIVHGHDEAAKETVARFIEKVSLKAIILHEQPNAGRTIIEKFEDYSNVGFAIVLLTPDDLGASRDKRVSKYKPRARQNVILELGYFMGKLGRGRVCALYKEGVETPSDYQGVLYIQMDDAGAWRMSLAKEIKQAGIEADLNKI